MKTFIPYRHPCIYVVGPAGHFLTVWRDTRKSEALKSG